MMVPEKCHVIEGVSCLFIYLFVWWKIRERKLAKLNYASNLKRWWRRRGCSLASLIKDVRRKMKFVAVFFNKKRNLNNCVRYPWELVKISMMRIFFWTVLPRRRSHRWDGVQFPAALLWRIRFLLRVFQPAMAYHLLFSSLCIKLYLLWNCIINETTCNMQELSVSGGWSLRSSGNSVRSTGSRRG